MLPNSAFSDGMFSIAATLLVLDLAAHPPGTPLQQVLHAWTGYLAYVVSFLTIGAAWLVHTALTDRLARSDPVFPEINLLVLLMVAFLPFPTRLVTDALHEAGSADRVAVTIYGLTLLAIRLLGPPWVLMHSTSTSTPRGKTARNRRARNEDSCPS